MASGGQPQRVAELEVMPKRRRRVERRDVGVRGQMPDLADVAPMQRLRANLYRFRACQVDSEQLDALT